MSKRSKVGFFCLGGILGVFLLAEIVARTVLGLGTPPLSMTDPDIEYLFKPNQDVMRFGNRQLYNAYSMRNEDFPKQKPAGEYRIVCFGDSVLNGGNLTDHSNLATTLLDGKLEKEWHKNGVVANVSAGSWGPPNMLAYARKYDLFDADYVIVQLSNHDIADVPTFAPLNPFTHPTKNPCCATWEGLTRYVPRYIPALAPLLQPAGPLGNSDAPEALESKAERRKKKQPICLQALSELCDMARAEGAGFVIVLHGEREEVATGRFKDGHSSFKEWARQHSVPVVDLGPVEAASLKAGMDPYRENDTIHLSDYGQRLLYDQLLIYFTDVL